MKYFLKVSKSYCDGEPTEEQAKSLISTYYKSLNQDIVKYVFYRHLASYEFFKPFEYMDLLCAEIKEINLTTEEVFSKLDYAKNCIWRDESAKYYRGFKNEEFYKSYHLNNTWPFPIVLTEIDGRYIALDGNNRLRLLKCYIKNSKNNVSCTHKAYLIINKET